MYSMPIKFLKEVVFHVVGKPSEDIVNHLDGNKYINEFLIAKKINLTVNQVRNILYKLSDQGVVSFIKKKDKRKGWYTFFWKIEVLKALELLENILHKRITEMHHQIKSRETKLFYICSRCNIEFNEETALTHNFTCPECGGVFDVKDSAQVVKEYKKNLNRLESELKEVNVEVNKERVRIEKIQIRKDKKEAKQKKAARKAKRKATEKARSKIKPPKKLSKKKAKYKPKKKSKSKPRIQKRIKKSFKKKFKKKKRI